jgi:RimJ/RimL family protein N-acetyltransferase
MLAVAWNLAPRLVGEIVILEPLTPAHCDELFMAGQPPEIWSWWQFNPAVDKRSFARWIEETARAADEGLGGHFATLDAASGRPIGSTSFCTPRPENRGLEIGWTWLTPSAWGTGANVEAKLLQLRYAFAELACIRVEFDTDEENRRSRGALEALGARFEGVLRDLTLRSDGRRRSSAYYSILEREWPDVEPQLMARVRAARERRAGSR